MSVDSATVRSDILWLATLGDHATPPQGRARRTGGECNAENAIAIPQDHKSQQPANIIKLRMGIGGCRGRAPR
ncbi:unnamed protein product, partial [Iphiclides podalirius]